MKKKHDYKTSGKNPRVKKGAEVSETKGAKAVSKNKGKSKAVVLISLISALALIIISITVGLIVYFNSHAYAMVSAVDAIKNKDGEKLESLIYPEDRDYINSLLSPIGMTLAEAVEPLNEFVRFDKDNYEISVESDGKSAEYTLTLPEENGGARIKLLLKKEEGKWYLSPTSLVDSLPIKTAVTIVSAIDRSDGVSFFSCILPDESRTIKLFGGLIGANEDTILKTFVDISKIDSENFDSVKVDSFKLTGDEATLTVSSEEATKTTLNFKNVDGKWYLSVKGVLKNFFGNEK